MESSRSPLRCLASVAQNTDQIWGSVLAFIPPQEISTEVPVNIKNKMGKQGGSHSKSRVGDSTFWVVKPQLYFFFLSFIAARADPC